MYTKLTQEQLGYYNRYGYVVVENVIDTTTIARMLGEIERWTHESRHYTQSYGALIDGHPRFDLEPGHHKTKPKLRRVTNPIEVSSVFFDTILWGQLPGLLTPILGEDIKFDHCKLNNKQPGMSAKVQYHQDHIFEPQTNDSVVVALLLLTDNTVENGCLRIVPGSHRTKYSHTNGGSFVGRIDASHTDHFDAMAHTIEGKAGSVCLMHTWSVHSSDRNRSSVPRPVLITEYKAADAYPLTVHKLPSRYMDAVVLGSDLAPRYREVQDFEISATYTGDSLFDLQDIVDEDHYQSAQGM